jgi:hypothetical protein
MCLNPRKPKLEDFVSFGPALSPEARLSSTFQTHSIPRSFQRNTCFPQSTELTRGLSELVQHLLLYGEYTPAQERCMFLNLIWFGSNARLSQWGGGGQFIPGFPRAEEGGWGGRHLMVLSHLVH